MKICSPVLVAVVGALLFASGSAQAAPAVTGVFNLPAQPVRAALGPDGNTWVTLASADPDIARVTPDGTVTSFTSPEIDFPVGITWGSDNKMWVTGTNYIAQFQVTNPGAIQKTTVLQIGTANDIINGVDGRLWTASGATAFRITPDETPSITKILIDVPGFSARGITSTPLDTVWIANGDASNPGMLPMSTAGIAGALVATPDGMVQDAASDSKGQIAFTNPTASVGRIGLINNGVLAPLTAAAPALDPTGITYGQDGAYWVAQFTSPTVGRFSSSGEYTSIPGLPANSGARRITKGSTDTLWVTLESTNQIARINGVGSTARPALRLRKVLLTNKRFRVGPRSTPLSVSRRATPLGTSIGFTLALPATVSIEVQRAKSGRRSGASCLKKTPALSKAKRCTRYLTLKTLLRRTTPGRMSVPFSGRFGKSKLAPGRYRFALRAKDESGSASRRVTKSFTIVKK